MLTDVLFGSFLFGSFLLCVLAPEFCATAGSAPFAEAPLQKQAGIHLNLTEQEASEIGKKIWQNEAKGSVELLTFWSPAEEFPSLGIGHFIWYPEGLNVPFEERFPRVLAFLQNKGVKLPQWLTPDSRCPWKTRDEFQADLNSEKMNELRNLLASTVPLQTEFMINRLQESLPKILEKAPQAEREAVSRRFNRLLSDGSKGIFCLVDYVNFKNEGIVETERYKGEGWGLLQVLEGMSDDGNPEKEFAESAIRVLERRIKNSPPARNEIAWLPGWKVRLNKYWQGVSENR